MKSGGDETTDLKKVLLGFLQEFDFLKRQTTDPTARNDYEIYIRDIGRFLETASLRTITSEEIQVYIDDYSEVIQHVKTAH